MKGFRNIDDSVKAEYLDWLMSPPAEREPSTKAEMAESLGVAVSTLWRWENEPEFQEELRSLKVKWGTKFHGEILGRLMNIVVNGTDTAAIQASKVLLPHLDPGTRAAEQEELIDEQIEAIREKLKALDYEVISRERDER